MPNINCCLKDDSHRSYFRPRAEVTREIVGLTQEISSTIETAPDNCGFILVCAQPCVYNMRCVPLGVYRSNVKFLK